MKARSRCARARCSPRSSPSTPCSSASPRSSPRSSRATGCSDAVSTEGLLLLGLAVFSAVLLNSLLLRRRLEPMDAPRADDGAASTSPRPGQRADAAAPAPPREVQRLTADFNRMLDRLEEERREAGRAVLRAQEQERSRIAQDLHDEVNQALTAILLRLAGDDAATPRPALRAELQETKQLATQAMEELLHARPPAAPDRARRPRPDRRRSPRRSPTSASAPASDAHLPPPRPRARRSPTRSSSCIYRVTQESLSNIAQHSGASARRRRAVVRRPHRPAHPRRRPRLRRRPASRRNGRRAAVGGLGLSGMRERALLVGGHLDVFSAPGEGTTIELTMGAT